MIGKTVAIVQSNYIPWKGYFDLINLVDEFILYDDAQYTRRDWRNRNKIKTAQGVVWLTIPVDVKGKYEQKIKETQIANLTWAKEHWKTLVHCYGRAPYFKEYEDIFSDLYLNCTETHLSSVNYRFIKAICDLIGIETPIKWSMDYELPSEGKTERLAALCLQAGASHYISGPAAKDYMDEQVFRDQGMSVSWMDYAGYREYPQLYPPFEHGVSILDLIFNVGADAKHYLKSFASAAAS
jgi:hypothetical protein